jgi:hypothetical protein
MTDRSIGLAIVVSLVLLLTFKDLLFVNTSVEQKQSSSRNKPNEPVNLPVNDEFNDDVDDEKSHQHHSQNDEHNDEDVLKKYQPEGNNDEDDHVKKIPSLKMKSNVQTVKFQFW